MKSNQQIQIQKYSIAIKMSTSQIRFTLRKVSSRRCSFGSHRHYFLQAAATTITNLTLPVRVVINNMTAFGMKIIKRVAITIDTKMLLAVIMAMIIKMKIAVVVAMK